MPTDQQLTNACISMTTFIVRKMTNSGRKGDRIIGPYDNVYRDAEELLVERLQITGALLPEAYGRAFHHLAVDITDLPSHFEDGRLNHTFDAIFQSYIELGSYFDKLPTTQFPFRPVPLPMHYEPDGLKESGIQSFVDLAALGYLDITPQGYRWTDKAAPYMMKSSQWHPDGYAHADANEAANVTAARAFIADIPEEIARVMRLDPDKAFWPIYHALTGGTWYRHVDNAVITRIIEMYKDKRR